MKVLLNIRWPVGGIRTYIRYVYGRFPTEKFSFIVVSPDAEGIDHIKADLGGRVENSFACRPTNASYLRAFLGALKSSEVDLVHSHGLSSGLLAALPMKFSPIPHVMTLHDVFVEGLFIGIKGRFRHLLINMGLRLPDVIHILGEDQRQNLEKYFPIISNRKSKLAIVRSGIEIERFLGINAPSEMDSFRADWRIPATKQILGFFGRYMGQKGFGTLVDAIDILQDENGNDSTPMIIAFGRGGFLEREKRNLRARGLIEHFRFLPFFPNIGPVMSKLDGIVMPSRWEAVGLLAMEALTAGIPLLASDCIGLQETTRATPAFIFKADNPPDLAMKIRDWSFNLRKEEFSAFAPEAARRFDVRKTAAGLQRLYSQFVSE